MLNSLLNISWNDQKASLSTSVLDRRAHELIDQARFLQYGWIPQQRHAPVVEAAVAFNYTTILNLVFLVPAALPLVGFLRTGGHEMRRRMK